MLCYDYNEHHKDVILPEQINDDNWYDDDTQGDDELGRRLTLLHVTTFALIL